LLEADSHAKVQMRRKVRGLRAIQQEVLHQRAKTADLGGNSLDPTPPSPPPGAKEEEAVPRVAAAEDQDRSARVVPTSEPSATEPPDVGQVVLDYCAAVRGILNDDQGGPLHPPGLRMADALGEVRQSLRRCVGTKKGGPQRSSCGV
jgi:hypothetical protein